MSEEKPKSLGGRPRNPEKPAEPVAAAPEIDYDRIITGVAAIIIKNQQETDTRNMSVGSPSSTILADGAMSVVNTDIEAIDKPLNSSYLDDLAFMEENITIMVSESTDPMIEKLIPVGVNGQFVYFPRGRTVTVKRKFVEGLIVKCTHISTPEFTNPGGE